MPSDVRPTAASSPSDRGTLDKIGVGFLTVVVLGSLAGWIAGVTGFSRR